MINEKKSKTIKISIVIIILLIVLSFVGYLIYDRTNLFKNNIKVNIDYNYVYDNNIDLSNITETELRRVIDDELYLLLGKNNLSELTNQEKLRMLFLIYRKDKNPNDDFEINYLKSIHENSVLNNLVIEYTDINAFYRGGFLEETNNILFKIDNESGKYINTQYTHGDISINYYANLVDFKQIDNKYIISYKYLFSANTGDGPTDIYLYTSIEDAKNLNKSNAIFQFSLEQKNWDYDELKNEVNSYVKENYDNLKDKLDTYTYIFEIVNNKLTLTDFYINNR